MQGTSQESHKPCSPPKNLSLAGMKLVQAWKMAPVTWALATLRQ